MGIEIERRFLVRGDGWRSHNAAAQHIVQGYLNLHKERTVRVRIIDGETACQTIKGISRGARRKEYEYDLPIEDAKEILELREGSLIEKRRTSIPAGDVVWEVDEFFGDNEGLVVAEVELSHEEQEFDLPEWLGEEVTGDPRYANSSLVTNPYKNWRAGAEAK